MPAELDNRYKRLRDYRLPEVLLSLWNARKTGMLFLKNWPAEKTIYIKNGNVVFAASNMEEDCLGPYLLAQKMITVTQYYESIRLIEKTGKRHGAILAELGYLTSKQIEDAVRKQIETIVLSVFQWEDGYVFFEEAPFEINEPITLQTEIHELIYKGVRTIDSFPQIRNALPLTTVLIHSSGTNAMLKKFKFNEGEKKVISLINSKNTVLDILKELGGDDLETLRLLYALASMETAIPMNKMEINKTAMLDAISVESGHEALYKKGTELFMNGDYNSSMNAFKKAVDLNPQKALYHFYLALSLINTSMFQEAENVLIRAIEIEPFNDDYYTELGKVYTKLGNTRKAVTTFAFALRLNPHNENARQAISEKKAKHKPL